MMSISEDSSLPSLIRLISSLKDSIPLPPPTASSAASEADGGPLDSGDAASGDAGNAQSRQESEDGMCWGLFEKKPKDGTDKKDGGGGSGAADGSGHSIHESNRQLYNQVDRLERDLRYIKNAIDKLQVLDSNLGDQYKHLQEQAHMLDRIFKDVHGDITLGASNFLTKKLQAIRAVAVTATKFKYQIPLPHMSLGNAEGHRNVETFIGFDAYNSIDRLLKLHHNVKFQACSAFKDFEVNYQSLEPRHRLCLLCFSVFPENAFVSRRLLIYWWIGEGFVDPDLGGEKDADGILKLFLEKGFLQPVLKKQRLVGFRMHSLTRYAVIFRAEKAGFFDFDPMGNPTADYSLCRRACLVKFEEKYSRKELMNSANPERIQTLFNVSDPYPDLKPEWFSRMTNANVLCMGRWEKSFKKRTEAEETKSHIELEGVEFLKGLKNMKHLKFLSLQGISRINELPDTIWSLSNLRILDLNACHNLESLPVKIVSLQKLIHLDISECYLLDYMPKGLGSLTELQVLKGFVISDLKIKNSGSLDDLAGLTKLRKLSIYTSKRDFPTDPELEALRRITSLRKLTIVWGGKAQTKPEANQPAPKKLTGSGLSRISQVKMKRLLSSRPGTPELPKGLEKLDIQCYPGTDTPRWLMPSKLQNLKKLYIRGGNLKNLGQGENEKWEEVKILRLKFLQEFKMYWKELQNAFPKLLYLEKVRCPNLTFFPCNESGMWLKRKKLTDSWEQLPEGLEFTWSFLGSSSTWAQSVS